MWQGVQGFGGAVPQDVTASGGTHTCRNKWIQNQYQMKMGNILPLIPNCIHCYDSEHSCEHLTNAALSKLFI